MHIGNSHKHENSKDSEVTLGIYGILDKGEKGGGQGIDFRSENVWFTSG